MERPNFYMMNDMWFPLYTVESFCKLFYYMLQQTLHEPHLGKASFVFNLDSKELVIGCNYVGYQYSKYIKDVVNRFHEILVFPYEVSEERDSFAVDVTYSFKKYPSIEAELEKHHLIKVLREEPQQLIYVIHPLRQLTMVDLFKQ